MIKNITTVSSRKDLEEFVKLQAGFYEGDPNFVPPLVMEEVNTLDKNKNPFFRHAQASFWTLRGNGKPLARISAVVDLFYQGFHKEKVGFFGHFEARDEESAHLLLGKAREWLASKGVLVMRGPISLSTNYICGLLVEGHETMPVIQMPYNPKEYATWLESFGLKKAKDLFSFLMTRENTNLDRVLSLGEKLEKKGNFSVRHVDMKRFDQEMERIRGIYNQAWEENWGFVPLQKEEFRFIAKSFKQIVKPEFCNIVEAGGEAIGFLLMIPDLNPAIKACNGRLTPAGIVKLILAMRRIKRARVILLGVKKGFRRHGVEVMLIARTIKAGLKHGFQEADLSWILEDNHALLGPLQKIGAKKWKTFRIYETPVNS